MSLPPITFGSFPTPQLSQYKFEEAVRNRTKTKALLILSNLKEIEQPVLPNGIIHKEDKNKEEKKSWAALFHKGPQPQVQKETPIDIPKLHSSLHSFLKYYQISNTAPPLQPRGLINRGNLCFMNSILQPLLYSLPFHHLLTSLGKQLKHDFYQKTPLLNALILFIQEFPQFDSNNEIGEPILPEYIYDALNADKRFKSIKGRQEDAEEFLGFLLDGLHEEFLIDEPATLETEEWVEVRAKQKQLTRNMTVQETPITKIFGGQLRSILKQTGQKDSVTIEPFHSLPLDISLDSILSIEEAILHLTHPESLTPQITKQILIQKLPLLLIIHLKRFVYAKNQVCKIKKEIKFGKQLEIPQACLALKNQQRTFELFGVVYHHGNAASDGHYTSAVYRKTSSTDWQWTLFDDSALCEISEEEVMKPNLKIKGDPYLLFYRLLQQQQ